jgi:nitrogen fixation protein FixH
VADAEAAAAVAAEEEAVAVAVAFPEVVVAAAAFRGAVAAVFRDPVEEISPAEVSVAPLGRGTFPAAAETGVWLIPETPHRAPERPLDND